MKILLLFVLWCVTVQSSLADATNTVPQKSAQAEPVALSRGRLGETREQIETRYGKSVMTDNGDEGVYQKSGLRILVHYYEGKADNIMFWKAKKDASGNPETMSDNEIQILLKVCGGEKKMEAFR